MQDWLNYHVKKTQAKEKKLMLCKGCTNEIYGALLKEKFDFENHKEVLINIRRSLWEMSRLSYCFHHEYCEYL